MELLCLNDIYTFTSSLLDQDVYFNLLQNESEEEIEELNSIVAKGTAVIELGAVKISLNIRKELNYLKGWALKY